jgi:hypothetical protein
MVVGVDCLTSYILLLVVVVVVVVGCWPCNSQRTLSIIDF